MIHSNGKPNMERLTKIVDRGQFIVLDTETSGLGPRSEIIQLAICDAAGDTLVNRLVKPVGVIDPEAEKVHGICTRKALDEGEHWSMVFWTLDGLLREGLDLIIYNASFDMRMIWQTCKLHSVDSAPTMAWVREHPPVCAMLAYAEKAEWWDDYHKNWKWHKLTDACEREGIVVQGAHDALGDTLMTLALIRKIGGTNLEKTIDK